VTGLVVNQRKKPSMQIKNNALSLLDYIGKYAKTEQAFERGINNQKRDVAADLRALQQVIQQ
jgi:hypothetical protein